MESIATKSQGHFRVARNMIEVSRPLTQPHYSSVKGAEASPYLAFSAMLNTRTNTTLTPLGLAKTTQAS